MSAHRIIRTTRTCVEIHDTAMHGDAVFFDVADVPALIEALRTVTAEAPECSVCGEPATANILWHDDTTRNPVKRCHKHSMTVTPIETVTEVTI